MQQRPYEYLIGQFAAGSGKKAGEFYTPQRISDILSAIVALDSQEPKTGKRKHLASVMDFACGSGSLLLNVRKRMGPHGIGKIYGQEKNITTYNLARMNMLLHGVKDSEFEIYHGDTLTNDWDLLRETNPAKKPQFDAMIANPPFSYRWDPNEALGEDMRCFWQLHLAHFGGLFWPPCKRASKSLISGHLLSFLGTWSGAEPEGRSAGRCPQKRAPSLLPPSLLLRQRPTKAVGLLARLDDVSAVGNAIQQRLT